LVAFFVLIACFAAWLMAASVPDGREKNSATLVSKESKMPFGKHYLAPMTAIALIASPVVAQAAETKAKPVAAKAKRAPAAAKEESKLGGGSGVIVAVVAAAAVILGIVLLSDDDEPNSP
jgi:hypothetical protein